MSSRHDGRWQATKAKLVSAAFVGLLALSQVGVTAAGCGSTVCNGP